MLVILPNEIVDSANGALILIVCMMDAIFFVDINVFYDVIPMLLRMQNATAAFVAETKKPSAPFFHPGRRI